MKAIAINAYGTAPVLTELPKPRAGRGQVLIRIRAAGMNPMDRAIASGAWKNVMTATFPLVLGADVAGVVEAVGDGMTKFAEGDELFGQLFMVPLGSTGTYAEYVAAAEDAPLAPIPRGLDPVVAASLPAPGGTALNLADSLQPLTGKTILVVGAAGAVGTFFTQFAAQAGARVTATAREQDAGRVRSYGAAETIDYLKSDLGDAVRRAHTNGVDVLVDLASDAEAFRALASLVRRGGTAITTRDVADEKAAASMGVTGVNFHLDQCPELLARVGDAVASGRVVPPPITRVTLGDVPVVWGRASHGMGKLVVLP
jgi:NADPH:quinone reductase-like Zn-dependent oxidoreductase